MLHKSTLFFYFFKNKVSVSLSIDHDLRMTSFCLFFPIAGNNILKGFIFDQKFLMMAFYLHRCSCSYYGCQLCKYFILLPQEGRFSYIDIPYQKFNIMAIFLFWPYETLNLFLLLRFDVWWPLTWVIYINNTIFLHSVDILYYNYISYKCFIAYKSRLLMT